MSLLKLASHLIRIRVKGWGGGEICAFCLWCLVGPFWFGSWFIYKLLLVFMLSIFFTWIVLELESTRNCSISVDWLSFWNASSVVVAVFGWPFTSVGLDPVVVWLLLGVQYWFTFKCCCDRLRSWWVRLSWWRLPDRLRLGVFTLLGLQCGSFNVMSL